MTVSPLAPRPSRPDALRASLEALAGRNPSTPMAVAGIDLGGTKVHVALADIRGAVLIDRIEPTDRRGGVHVVDQIGRIVEACVRDAGLDAGALRAAALGSPGVLDPVTGRINISSNIPGFDRFDVAGALRGRLGCPLVVENDVNLAALGEQWQGCCADTANFAFVALGTGIGMGLIVGGDLVRGGRGAAGEIAFLPVGADPFDPSSYPLGSLETAIGSVGILGRYRAFGGRVAGSVRTIFDQAALGDSAAKRTLDVTARILFQALLAVTALLDPDVIVLGGGIGARVELVDRVRTLAGLHPVTVPVRQSALGSRAVLIGATSVALAALCGGSPGITPSSESGTLRRMASGD